MNDRFLDVERQVLAREIEQGEVDIEAIDLRIQVLQRQRDRYAITVARWRQELAAMKPRSFPRFDVHAD